MNIVELFNSIGDWFIVNKDQIIGFLLSTNTLGFLAALINFIKNNKLTKDNTSSSKQLTAALDTTNLMSTNIDTVKNNLETVLVKLAELFTDSDEKDTENSAQIAVLTKKVNAMLKVQQLVYTTIADDNIRNSVISILAAAENDSTESAKALKIENTELKREILKLITENANLKYEESTEEIKDSTSESEITDDSQTVLKRY